MKKMLKKYWCSCGRFIIYNPFNGKPCTCSACEKENEAKNKDQTQKQL